MGQHKSNPTAIAYKNGEIVPKSKKDNSEAEFEINDGDVIEFQNPVKMSCVPEDDYAKRRPT